MRARCRAHCTSALFPNDSSGDSFRDPSPPKMLADSHVSPISILLPPSLFTRLCLNAATQWGSYVFGRRASQRTALVPPLEGGNSTNEPRNSPLATIVVSRPKIIFPQFWPDLPARVFLFATVVRFVVTLEPNPAFTNDDSPFFEMSGITATIA